MPSVLKTKSSFISIAQEKDNLTPLSPGAEYGCLPRQGLKQAVSARELKTRASSCQINSTWRSDGQPPNFDTRNSNTGVKSGKSFGTLNSLVSWLRDSKKSNIKSSKSIFELNTVRRSTEDMSTTNRRRSETVHMMKSSTVGAKNRLSRSHPLNAGFCSNQTSLLDDEEIKSSPLIMNNQQRIISTRDEVPKSEPSVNRLESEIPTRYSLEVYEEEDGDDHSSFHTVDGRDEETHDKDGFCLPKWPGASHHWSTASHPSESFGQWSVTVGKDEVLLPVEGLGDGQADPRPLSNVALV